MQIDFTQEKTKENDQCDPITIKNEEQEKFLQKPRPILIFLSTFLILDYTSEVLVT